MNLKVSTSLPITFEKIADTEDKRFTAVRIFLCHTGVNLNNSFFDKPVLEGMIPSLSNIPIVGYISVDNFDESDFNGHEERLVIDEDGMRFEYLGRAYGMIPETNNSRFEMKICDDGIEREFLVCDGFLWNKFIECVDIFNRDTAKSQSMELFPDSIQGRFEKDGLFHFTGAKFDSACILGDSVIPAMTGSVVEKFSKDILMSQLNEMITEFMFSINKDNLSSNLDDEIDVKGGTNVLEKVIEMLQKYTLTVEDLNAKEINYEEFASVEELEIKVQEVFAKEEPSPAPNFSLTHEQVEGELRRELGEIEIMVDPYWDDYTYPRYSLIDFYVDRGVAIAYDNKEGFLVGFSFTITGDSVEADSESKARYKVDFLPMDLSADPEFEFSTNKSSIVHVDAVEHGVKVKEFELMKQIDELKSTTQTDEAKTELEKVQADFAALQEKFSALEVKAGEMETQLNSIAQEDREAAEDVLFEQFSEKLTEEDMAEVKARKSELSLEEIKKELALVFAMKNLKFSVIKENKPLRIDIPTDNKPKSDKVYADLIESRSKSV